MKKYFFTSQKNILNLVVLSLLCAPLTVLSQQRTSTIKLPDDIETVRKAQAGNADAQAFVGKYYYFGECGVKENEKEAFRWFQKSAAKGSPYGYYYIGLCYSNGYGVAQNYDRGESYFAKAVKILNERANSGDAEAQYHLGLCYKDGIGVEESKDIASSWFKKSSDQGHPYGQYETALNEKDQMRAFNLMKQAADYGIREAVYQLGMFYKNGKGCEQSKEESARLILKSAQMGDGDAQVRIAFFYEEGYGLQKSLTESFKWFKKAADENGMYEGYLETGCKYRDGHGVDHNYNLAIKYLNEASDMESYRDDEASEALRNLKRIGRTAFMSQPKRCKDDIYELKDDDPFLSYTIPGWENLSIQERTDRAKSLKREKIHAWGQDVANKVVLGTYDIGYTMEQIAFALRDRYTKKYFDTPNGRIIVFITYDRNFYFKDDVLFAMVYENGATVGNITLIKSHDGNVKFIRSL